MQVRDVLKAKQRGVITVGPEATVADALALLVPHNIGSLPVVDSSGRLVGIFTERDVLHGVHKDCERFNRQRVGSVMTRDPWTCAPDDDVHEVMGTISRHQVGQLPVVAGGAVVGVVSVGDLIKALYQKVDAENQHLLSYLYGPG
jgi:CBS domain-containing protein